MEPTLKSPRRVRNAPPLLSGSGGDENQNQEEGEGCKTGSTNSQVDTAVVQYSGQSPKLWNEQ